MSYDQDENICCKRDNITNGTDVAAEKLDDMIKKFIEEKTTEYTSFKVINIQYRPTIESERYWYPSAMLVYDE